MVGYFKFLTDNIVENLKKNKYKFELYKHTYKSVCEYLQKTNHSCLWISWIKKMLIFFINITCSIVVMAKTVTCKVGEIM